MEEMEQKDMIILEIDELDVDIPDAVSLEHLPLRTSTGVTRTACC